MTRELIFIHVGEHGVRLGLRFWELCAAEHGLDATGRPAPDTEAALAEIGAMFERVGVSLDDPKVGPCDGRYVPRALFVDLDPAGIELVRASPIGSVVDAKSLVAGDEGTDRRWSKGHGAEALLARVSAALEDKVRTTPRLDGFVIFHALGGGTGAGFGALLLEHLRARYPDQVIATFSVLPKTGSDEKAAELFDATLALPSLQDRADLVFLLDAAAIASAGEQLVRPGDPASVEEGTHVAASAIAGVSALWRWAGGMSLRAMTTALTPQPEARLVTIAHQPRYGRAMSSFPERHVTELVTMLHDNRRSGMATADPRHGRTFASLRVDQGDVAPNEVFEVVDRVARDTRYDGWTPGNAMVRLLPKPLAGPPRAATWIVNTTSVGDALSDLWTASDAFTRRPDEAVRSFFEDGLDRSALDGALERISERVEWYREARES